MTVDNPNVVDFVAHDPKADVVSLVLVEHRDWGADGTLLPELQRKLNTYLAYVLEGQFVQEYPDLQGKRLRFDLRAVHPLGTRELEFLAIVQREILDSLGIELTWKQVGMDAESAP